MQAHHFDPMTGEDEFLAEEEEARAAITAGAPGRGKTGQWRTATGLEAKRAPPPAARPQGGEGTRPA